MPNHVGTFWLARNWPELRSLDGRWVAASEQGLEADAASYSELLAVLAERDVSRPSVAVLYVWFGAYA